jgi:hypothetical protein
MSLRPVQEKLQRRAASKAIKPAIVRIDPIEGAVGGYSRSGGDAERIKIIEFTLHGRRRHGCLPDAPRVQSRSNRLRSANAPDHA